MGENETLSKPRSATRTRLFLRLLMNCIVQYELIQTVDNILFFASHSRHEDAVILSEARSASALLNNPPVYPSVPTSLHGATSPAVATSSSPHKPEDQRLLEAVAETVDGQSPVMNKSQLSSKYYRVLSLLIVFLVQFLKRITRPVAKLSSSKLISETLSGSLTKKTKAQFL